MKIEVNKNELERALIALGKLISRMSPVPEHKALLAECKDGKVCFSTLAFSFVHLQSIFSGSQSIPNQNWMT